MSVAAFMDERVTFSLEVPAEVNALLQQAVALTSKNRQVAETLFLQALEKDQRCLHCYFALYKFYFYQKRLTEAERIVILGLAEAARQGNFPNDSDRLVREPEKWNLHDNELGLFYLYTMKALAFIKLRQEQQSQSHLILEQIAILDPNDLSGASVIMQIAEALEGND